MKDQSIVYVKGIGRERAKDAENLSLYSLLDMLLLSPRTYEDRRKEKLLKDASIDDPEIMCRVRVRNRIKKKTSHGKGLTPIIVVSDEEEDLLTLICINREYLYTMLVEGSEWYIKAKIIKEINRKNVANYKSLSFEIKKNREDISLGKILPIYPLSGKLTEKIMRELSSSALSTLLPLRDPLSTECREKYNLLPINEAFRNLHYPESFEMLKKAKDTLSFIELYILEVNAIRKRPLKKENTRAFPTQLEERLVSSLPFSLTEDQKRCINEIRLDLDSSEKMNRLLQGDVGSGKTLVALISVLRVIEKGGQCALMAPTELLSRQHEENAMRLLSPLGVNVSYLSGESKGKNRKEILQELNDGNIDLIIGTHALFSKDVKYKNLKYIIIDEQHRFGVAQRGALIRKGKNCDILSMTATPIPRTLAETLYAHMDLSLLKEKPQGRKDVITYTVKEESRERMLDSIKVEFERGHQAYFVYPRIEKEEDEDLKDVKTMYNTLKKKYPEYEGALLHSKLSEKEKTSILEDFKNEKITYIVSTTVIEVGLDIPKATVMVIENAERYGLSQLHQLRGRVGRSDLQSYCFLVFSGNLTAESRKRLRIIKETTDGFKIAEEDLHLRGPGSFEGSEQSGFSTMAFASIENEELLKNVRCEAENTIREDRNLDNNPVLNEVLKEYF